MKNQKQKGSDDFGLKIRKVNVNFPAGTKFPKIELDFRIKGLTGLELRSQDLQITETDLRDHIEKKGVITELSHLVTEKINIILSMDRSSRRESGRARACSLKKEGTRLK